MADLPWLETAGNRIVRSDTGDPVILRGINRSGLEYAEPGEAGFLASAGITREDVRQMVAGWGARVVRLPFNQDWVLRGRGRWEPAHYRAALDQVAVWAAEAGAYTLLDLQWRDADTACGTNRDGTINRVPALPDPDTTAAWRVLAARYRDVPGILYDVFTEPHDPLPDDTSALYGVGDDGGIVVLERRVVTPAVWHAWARHLVRAIREEHPRALVFVSGIDWGYDLQGMPLTGTSGDPLPDVVYSSHVYPWAGLTGGFRLPALGSRGPRAERREASRRRGGWASWFAGRSMASWERAFGGLADRCPVFVAECGGERRHCRWGARLFDYLDEREIGWAAWSWSDWPHLRAARDTYEPSAFGTIARDALTRTPLP